MYLVSKIVLPLAVIAGLVAWPMGASVLSTSGGADQGGMPADPQPKPAADAPAAAEDVNIAEAAKAIDGFIDAGIAKQTGLKVRPKTKDDQFLRRAYLDLAGRIPTMEEAGEFLGTKKKDKREALVKKLLASEAYVSNTFNWWADMLRARNRLQDRYDGIPYMEWIKDSIRSNKPYDKFVFELICAEGPGTARGNGVTGYYIADAGMPQDNMANTVRLFLGTRLTCAQCHDHPFDKWTRRDFFEMAAFTEGTDVKTNEGELDRAVKSMGKKVPYAADQIARRMGETMGMKVSNADAGAINLPDNYQYKDARPNQRVNAVTMFKDDILKDRPKSQSVRETYAKWMTSPTNPRFTTVIVNRVWKRLMRVGLIEPLDNLDDETKPSNPELLEHLVKLMKDVKYDLRKFQEIICATEAYQRSSTVGDPDRFNFKHEGQPLHRITAEQMWDSLMTLTTPNVDAIKGKGAEHLYRFYDANKDKKPQDLAELILKAGEAQDEIDEANREIREIREKMKGGDKSGEGKIKELENKQNGLRATADVFTPYYDSSYKDQGNEHRRASELESPMPPGHFLRVFGQSNRLLINNGSFESLNLTQALELMNGFVEQTILADDSKSVLKMNIAKGRTPDEKVKILYLSILSRLPNASETSYGLKVMSLAPNKRGDEYLGWALINSAEFAFNE
jgi:Protein of unknown function (DUF1549)/Protein of unknown function (DUF1553)